VSLSSEHKTTAGVTRGWNKRGGMERQRRRREQGRDGDRGGKGRSVMEGQLRTLHCDGLPLIIYSSV